MFSCHGNRLIKVCSTDSPEEVLVGGVEVSHHLPLLLSAPPNPRGQDSHHAVREIRGATVGLGEDVYVWEPIGGLASVPLAHQKDTKSHEGGRGGLPPAETNTSASSRLIRDTSGVPPPPL